MANGTQRELWCLIKGDSTPFSVIAPGNDRIDDLKERIRKKRKYGVLQGIDATDLVLLKLEEPELIGPEDTLPQRIGSKKVSKFQDSSATVLDEFPEEPTARSVHISVVSPSVTDSAGMQKRNITPKAHELNINVIDEKIVEELKSIRVVVETFLKDPESPTWVPPKYVTPSNREFLTSLQIPSYDNGDPSLLFHNLDVCDSNEIEELFGPGVPLCICNTSGSGKTRRIMEGLTKYWGFYLVAARDVNGVGIRDLEDALRKVRSVEGWMTDLHGLPSEKRIYQDEVNSLIVSKQLQTVLAARIVVFRLFLELAIAAELAGEA